MCSFTIVFFPHRARVAAVPSMDRNSSDVADILASNVLLVNGSDITTMTFLQLQKVYSALFPGISVRGRSTSEIFNSIVSVVIRLFTEKKEVT